MPYFTTTIFIESGLPIGNKHHTVISARDVYCSPLPGGVFYLFLMLYQSSA